MADPRTSFWPSAAGSRVGAARGFWTAEVRRRRTAMANEMVRQTMAFRTRTWMAPIAGHEPKRRR